MNIFSHPFIPAILIKTVDGRLPDYDCLIFIQECDYLNRGWAYYYSSNDECTGTFVIHYFAQILVAKCMNNV